MDPDKTVCGMPNEAAIDPIELSLSSLKNPA